MQIKVHLKELSMQSCLKVDPFDIAQMYFQNDKRKGKENKVLSRIYLYRVFIQYHQWVPFLLLKSNFLHLLEIQLFFQSLDITLCSLCAVKLKYHLK